MCGVCERGKQADGRLLWKGKQTGHSGGLRARNGGVEGGFFPRIPFGNFQTPTIHITRLFLDSLQTHAEKWGSPAQSCEQLQSLLLPRSWGPPTTSYSPRHYPLQPNFPPRPPRAIRPSPHHTTEEHYPSQHSSAPLHFQYLLHVVLSEPCRTNQLQQVLPPQIHQHIN